MFLPFACDFSALRAQKPYACDLWPLAVQLDERQARAAALPESDRPSLDLASRPGTRIGSGSRAGASSNSGCCIQRAPAFFPGSASVLITSLALGAKQKNVTEGCRDHTDRCKGQHLTNDDAFGQSWHSFDLGGSFTTTLSTESVPQCSGGTRTSGRRRGK